MERYKTKNENVEKAATAEKKLNDIRTYLSEKAKTGDNEAIELLKEFDAAVEDGKKAGINNVSKQIKDAINNNPYKFIIGQFKDLNPDDSYSSLKDVYHELKQLINKSDLGRSLDLKVELARAFGAKTISEQEQTFIDEIKQAINNGKIKDVVAWITTVNWINKYVLEPAAKEGSVRPDKANKIVQNAEDALNKLNASQGQQPAPGTSGAPGTTEAQGNKVGAPVTGVEQPVVFDIAEEAAVSELLAEMSKRKAGIEKLITGIKNADTKLLYKANAAILQFSAESQAILNKVALSDEEKKQLQKLQEQLNSVVEAKAKELKVGTKTLTVSANHLNATEEHIKNLMKEKETEYEKVITNYHKTVIGIFAEMFNIPEESIDEIIDETLDERKKRHRALGEVLRNRRSTEEKPGPIEQPKLFDTSKGQTQTPNNTPDTTTKIV